MSITKDTEEKIKQEIRLHTVYKNTDIYRGYRNPNIRNINHVKNDLESSKGDFFTEIKDTADDYGGGCATYKFKLNQDLNLIDMPTSSNVLYKYAPENVKQILSQCYGANKDNKRSSYSGDKDRIVGDFCCELGYDGYYIGLNRMEVRSDFDSKAFAESEMYICEPINKFNLNAVEKMNTEKEDCRIPAAPQKKRKVQSPSKHMFGFMPKNHKNVNPKHAVPKKLNFDTPPRTPGGYRGGYVICPSKISQKNISKKSKMVRSKTKSRKSQRKTSHKSQKTSSSYLP
jgi:hypothetical protein